MPSVKEIAEKIAPENADSQKLRQRIRDEIKRQNIPTKKQKKRIEISSVDALNIINALKPQQNEAEKRQSSRNLEDKLEESSRNIKKLQENLDKKDAELDRLHRKIEKYADDFKELNDKQIQLNDQQQQLQARLMANKKEIEYQGAERKKLELTNTDLKSENKKLDKANKELTSKNTELDAKNTDLQQEVDKIKNATFWQRLFKRY